jgi:hypothetical protein
MLSFEIVIPDADWLSPSERFRRLRVPNMVSSIAHSSLPLISEPTDYFKEPITGSSKVPRRRGCDTEQKPGLSVVGRRIPCRKRCRRLAER